MVISDNKILADDSKFILYFLDNKIIDHKWSL